VRRAIHLVGRELRLTWSTPLPYVVGAVFHALVGLMYVAQLEERRQALIQPMFPLAGFLLVLVVPLLAMRTIADETRSGSLDLLIVAGVPARVLVAGKWVAVFVTTIALLTPTSVFVLLLHLYGNPEPGPIVAGYLGLVFLGALLGGLGVFASSLTTSPPVAVAAALFVAIALWFAHLGPDAIATGGLLARLSLSERLRSFASGGLDTGDVAFFVLAVVVTLTLAGASLRSRRLR
jgi:ABC-2 type transport system permease protein